MKHLCRCALFALCTLAATFAHAAGQSVVANGIQIYYGIAPASAAVKANVLHDSNGFARLFHAGSHHLVVSLADARTGERINDATVVATVAPLGLTPTTRALPPMEINNTITYGNFFDFSPSSGPYRISLHIMRSSKGAQEPVIAEFEYRPAMSSGR
ncbi:MAG TPA: hypothetical protein VJ698_07640 [Noviherbaspirillum sp.]|uniref:hypothetical protein n=1 Tax=Noviherbaspirillum sp. TaxID=1926288 RepID=UPI002B49B609|nr:hypothetical protein [Noviherbaspirillum sp.]HJV85335.1 hypothetical protein [Noviherbaspirillum sp.]